MVLILPDSILAYLGISPFLLPLNRLMSDEEQKNLATWFEYNFWPKSYDRYSLYINFTKHRRYNRLLVKRSDFPSA